MNQGFQKKVLMLMANDPRAYREVISEAIRSLRPGVRVETTEPEKLEDLAAELRPHMVVGNEVPETVRSKVPAWIELYPEHGTLSVVSFEGECSTVNNIQLSDILLIVDRTERLAQSS